MLDEQLINDKFHVVPTCCCVANQSMFKSIPIEAYKLDDIALSETIIDVLINNMRIACNSCLNQENCAPFPGKFSEVAFIISHGVCNMKCRFCCVRELDNIKIFQEYDKVFRIIEALYNAGKLNVTSPLFHFAFTVGEFSIDSRQHTFYHKLEKLIPEALIVWHSNCAVYSNIIGKGLSEGNRHLVVSIPHVDNKKFQYMTNSKYHIGTIFENLSRYHQHLTNNSHPSTNLTIRLFVHKLMDRTTINDFIEKVYEYGLQRCIIDVRYMIDEKYGVEIDVYNDIKNYFNENFKNGGDVLC